MKLKERYPKDTKKLVQRGTCTLMFKAALSTTGKLWKESKCPSTDEWIKKMWCVCVCVDICVHTHTHTHTHTLLEYYSPIKKNEILPFATMWKELKCIMLSKVSRSEKDKLYDFTHIWNLRNTTDEHREKEGKIR